MRTITCGTTLTSTRVYVAWKLVARYHTPPSCFQ
jgi:hypothetical protein